jgi:DNA-binding winged helix-turn-helix (wHTH) protein
MNSRILPMQFSQSQDSLNAFTRPPARYARFGSFDLDFHREELFRSGARVALPRKVLEVLMILIERPGDLVTRETLRARLWPPDQNVNFDANVNTTVNKLRQVLGDSTNQPAFVETIPRRGYVFIAQTEYSDQPSIAGPNNQGTNGSQSLTRHPSLSQRLFPEMAAKHPSWFSLKVMAFLIVGMILGALASYLALHR